MMKKVFVFTLLALMLSVFGLQAQNRVEVLCFHAKQRCATCLAIEKNAKEVISQNFAQQVKNGTVVFKEIDISTKEGEKIADKYRVSSSSIFVNSWKKGKETRYDVSNFAFLNAKNNPDVFKKELKKKITRLLK
jgi:hypothetical protein